MPWWAWPLLAYFLMGGGTLALFWACGRIGAQHDTEPYDSMVDVVAAHRQDCACPDCWDRYQERLVRDYDWTAAEHDIAWRRP